MKKLIFAVLVSVAVVMMVTPVHAMELWDPHLRGSDIGTAAGALPPPGFYFVDLNYMMPGLNYYTGQGTAVKDTKLFVYVNSPVLVWVPGCKFLGADYAVAIAEPIVYTSLMDPSGVGGNSGQNWGVFGTVLVPYILSWKLPCDFRVKTALSITLNDGSSTLENSALGNNVFNGKNVTTFMAPSANNYYDFIPEVGISWLHAGWNFSADFFFSFETKDSYTGVQSGDSFFADYTITKTCGKWTFGLGAAQYNQVTNDSAPPGVSINGYTTMYTMGPILGYNFGPCSLTGTYQFALYSQDQFGGDYFFVRLVVPLGNPFK